MKNNFLGYVESKHYKRAKYFKCYLCSGVWISDYTIRCVYCNSANISVLPIAYMKKTDLELIENEEIEIAMKIMNQQITKPANLIVEILNEKQSPKRSELIAYLVWRHFSRCNDHMSNIEQSDYFFNEYWKSNPSENDKPGYL